MTVRELIEKLPELNPDAYVYIPETTRIFGWEGAERIVTHANYPESIVYVSAGEN